MMLRNILYKSTHTKLYHVSSIRHSALFINGKKATDIYVHLTPHIDFPENIKHKNGIQHDLIRRKSNIDLAKVENLWTIYEELRYRKSELTKKKEEISQQLSKSIKEQADNTVIEKLKIQSNLTKDNLKKLKEPLWSAEEAAIVEILKLPNKLHSLTPDNENKVIFENGTFSNIDKNHTDIGRLKNLIHFTKDGNYYLKGDAATFELGAKFYFSDLLKRNKFIQFSNTDFVKSLVVEGCGEEHTNSHATFILYNNDNTKENSDNRLHLTGAGSLYSFFAYHTKHIVYSKVLPLRYFSMGRQYVPSCPKDSLFHARQSSVVELFGVAKTADDVNMLLEEFIEITKCAYSQLGFHFRLSIVQADKLNMWESMRVAIEMYSSSLKNYVQIGNISVSGDFISKRLLFTYTKENKSNFTHIISGTILNVPKFLACVLEQDADFALPEPFKMENWVSK